MTTWDCPQVELRSYVSEPELATLGGDVAQSSLGLVGLDNRYQTLPGRGKASPGVESCRAPSPLTTLAGRPWPLGRILVLSLFYTSDGRQEL